MLSRATMVMVLLGASAAPCEEPWETVVTGPITIKNRARPNSPIKEIWAEGEIAAPVEDIEATLMTPSRLRYFMPYMKTSRELGKAEDGSTYVYTELALPAVGSRDYVTQVWLDQSATPEKRVFRNHWTAVPNKLPERRNVVRLQVNDGSWEVSAKSDDPTRSWVIYKFAVDPGGWVPAFAANLGNQQGVPETYKAVEKEAQRRAKERQK